MRLGIFAKTFAGTTPSSVIDAAARAGYSTVQYNMACSGLPAMPDRIDEEQAQDVARAALSAGVAIAAVSGTYNMIHPDRSVRKKGMARLAVLASRCDGMSAPMITLCTGTRDPDDQWRHHPDNQSREAWRDLLVEMELALRIAETNNIMLGIEPELANVVSSAQLAHDLLRQLQSPHLKVVLDPANLFERASLAEQHTMVTSAIDLLAPHIAMAHAKDRDGTGNVVAAGQGIIDFHHFISSLKAAGFDGPLVTHGLSATQASGAAAFLQRLLQEADAVTG